MTELEKVIDTWEYIVKHHKELGKETRELILKTIQLLSKLS